MKFWLTFLVLLRLMNQFTNQYCTVSCRNLSLFTEPDISDSHTPITPKLGKFYAFKYKQSKQCAQKLVS